MQLVSVRLQIQGREFNPGPAHTFAEIDHEIISAALPLPSADSRRAVVSYMQKYVHKVVVNCLVKHAQGKSVVRRTGSLNNTITVDWGVKHQIKQTTQSDILLQ